VGGAELVFEEFVNHQDNIKKTCKNFFVMIPNETEILYGFLNFHGLLNTRSRRGWICHCRLISTKEGAEGHNCVLWQIWKTRCVNPRIDGLILDNNGNVLRVQNLEKWLIQNELSNDLQSTFNVQYFRE
jgi:hypothetical protein